MCRLVLESSLFTVALSTVYLFRSISTLRKRSSFVQTDDLQDYFIPNETKIDFN